MKIFVLDTNVLLHDPEALLKFGHNYVIIPVTVLEELDKMKKMPGELGRNAREAFRMMDSLHLKGTGDLHNGITLPNGSVIRIDLELKPDSSYSFSPSLNDNKILLTAYTLNKAGKEKVVFVSKDFAARIKAEALGLVAEDYENLKFSYDAIYKGIRKVEIAKPEIDIFYKDGWLQDTSFHPKPNEYFILTSAENSSAVGKHDPKKKQLEPLIKTGPIWGVKPRNVEQRCAIDLLLRDDIKLVSLIGQAGTGKTLLALACGLKKVFDDNIYTRILVSRPVVPLGRDIGYLPGTKEEKLVNWMQPIYDNLEILCASIGHDSKETVNWVKDRVELEAVTYIRGRSLPKMFIIIDEAQNLTPHEIKTIVSRAGEGTKVVLTGDPTQIDNPYLDKDSNGLTYLVGRFSEQPIYGNMFFEKTERSELAALAAEIL
ncbi:MAG: PhoH family protein [Parachlamydiaceae bacterium]